MSNEETRMPSVSSLFSRARRAIDSSTLSGVTRSLRRERLTYLSRKLRRLETALQDALRRNVAGDVAEFGMALGGSAIVVAGHAQRAGRVFHGFDVFGMIPPPRSDNDDEKSKERYRTIADGRSQGLGGEVYYGYRDNLYDDVCRSLSKHGLVVDDTAIVLHKGLFEDTVPDAGIWQIAFVHIDCDWCDPVRYCLRGVADRVSAGGIIVLDDYHDYGGCRVATDEFLGERPDFGFEDGDNVILRRTRRNS
jgi:O-methyltransferase